MLVGRRYTIDVFGGRIGFEKSTIIHGRTRRPYLTRWILYVWFGTLRLHKFWRGDDDRASHTHPWWFITFPLRSYRERIYNQGRFVRYNVVKAWRFHYRPANFEHIVVSGLWKDWVNTPEPFYTLVVTGRRRHEWGFYPEPHKFIRWRDYDEKDDSSY